MRGMKKLIIFAVLAMALVSLTALYAAVQASSPACPWQIKGIEVGKWANGNLKDAIWAHGSFPIPPGVSERPTWFVNGVNLGHSTIFFDTRRVYPGAKYLKPKEQNTVTVKFFNPPYAGASHSRTFFYDPDRIAPGGSIVF